MLVLIEFTNALGTLIDLFRMVGIVAEENHLVGLNLEIKATVHTSEGLHTVFQFLLATAIELGHRHSGNAVLNIDGDGLSELDIGDTLDG